MSAESIKAYITNSQNGQNPGAEIDSASIKSPNLLNDRGFRFDFLNADDRYAGWQDKGFHNPHNQPAESIKTGEIVKTVVGNPLLIMDKGIMNVCGNDVAETVASNQDNELVLGPFLELVDSANPDETRRKVREEFDKISLDGKLAFLDAARRAVFMKENVVYNTNGRNGDGHLSNTSKMSRS